MYGTIFFWRQFESVATLPVWYNIYMYIYIYVYIYTIIYLHEWLIYMVNVGKYTNPMEILG